MYGLAYRAAVLLSERYKLEVKPTKFLLLIKVALNQSDLFFNTTYSFP